MAQNFTSGISMIMDDLSASYKSTELCTGNGSQMKAQCVT